MAAFNFLLKKGCAGGTIFDFPAVAGTGGAPQSRPAAVPAPPGGAQFVKKLKSSIFFGGMYVEKNTFCRPSVPRRGARRATAGRFCVNSAEFTRNLPHVPLCRKRPKAFFDRLSSPRGELKNLPLGAAPAGACRRPMRFIGTAQSLNACFPPAPLLRGGDLKRLWLRRIFNFFHTSP